MATYTTQQNFLSYTEDSGVNMPTGDALERLLLRAEHDIDRLIRPVEMLANSIQGITLANATGGTFKLSLVWNGATYTSPAISYNAAGVDVLAALQDMEDQYGNYVPLDAWAQPEQKYYSQPWAYGPLPGVPVVVEAVNFFGSQPIPVMTADTTGLTGATPTVTVSEIVRGGLKLNPYLLDGRDTQVLSNATCAQAEYRVEMGEQFFRRAQWASVSGPEFRTTGKLPLIGPKVKAEFSGSDLIQRGARARPGPITERQIVYSPVGTTPIPDDWRSI